MFSAVHSRLGVAHFDNLRFFRRKFLQPLFHDVTGAVVVCQTNVGCVMSGFGFEQSAVKVLQLCLPDMIAQEAKSFARPGFDQARDQEPIYRTDGFLFGDEFVEAATITTGLEPSKSNLTGFEEFQDQVEMFEFLIHDTCHFEAEFFVFYVSEDQVHCGTRCLFLAMRVVDQNLVQGFVDLLKPAPGSR